MMLKYYRYLYYKILRGIWSIRKSDIDEWTAVFIITASIWININSILTIPSIFWGKEGILQLSYNEVTVIGSALLLIHYFLFIHKGRWQYIVNEFKNESEEARKHGNRIAVLYAIGSPIVFFILNLIKMILWAH